MHDELDRPGDALLDRAEAVFTILEHEAMHHETLLYMWHRLPLEEKRGDIVSGSSVDGCCLTRENLPVLIEHGASQLGAAEIDAYHGHWPRMYATNRVKQDNSAQGTTTSLRPRFDLTWRLISFVLNKGNSRS